MQDLQPLMVASALVAVTGLVMITIGLSIISDALFGEFYVLPLLFLGASFFYIANELVG